MKADDPSARMFRCNPLPPPGMKVEVLCRYDEAPRPYPFLCCWTHEDGWVIGGTRHQIGCEVLGWRPFGKGSGTSVDAEQNLKSRYTAILLDWTEHFELQPIDLSDAIDDRSAKALGISRAMNWVTQFRFDCVRLHVFRDGFEIGAYDVTPHAHGR